MNMAFSDSRPFEGGDGSSALRPLAWGELCARLAAAQDLRRHQAGAGARGAGTDTTHLGSFHSGAAFMLEQHGGSQDLVNPTSSINRKDTGGKPVVSRETPLIERTMRQADENCHD
jgi:hypothetical protein